MDGITKRTIYNFTGERLKKLVQKKVLEEFDKSLPEMEPQIDKQLLNIKFLAKPSLLSRKLIQKIIPHLSDLIQVMLNQLNIIKTWICYCRTPYKIWMASVILKILKNTQLYQDTNDNLHMKLIYYSKIEPHRIYDQNIMPSHQKCRSDIFKQFQVYPTKKGCSLVYAELQFNENSYNTTNNIQNEDLLLKQTNIIRIVYTQKGFEKEGIHFIYRKYTGQEKYHYQIDQIYHLDQYKIITSALVIQPSNKQDYKSLLIEEIYFECEHKDSGQKNLQILLMNNTSNDRNLIEVQESIEQNNENVITQNQERLDTLQISYKLTEQDIFRITSKQHQLQSREESKIENTLMKPYTAIRIRKFHNDQLSNQTVLKRMDILFIMMGVQQEKHFNPILGETFQGRIKGCPIYLEQTSHHPPISNYIMFGRDYKLYGAFSLVVNMGCNSLSGEQHGHSVVHFLNSNLKFYYMNQPFIVYNIITGQRNVNCHKRSFCFQPDLQLCAVIQFNPEDKNGSFFSKSNQPIDYFLGQMYKVTPMCIERCKLAHRTGSGLNLKFKISAEEILERYEQINGRCTSHLDINNQKYWDINIHRPFVLEFESKPLPSDCLYRLDLLLMKAKDIQRAQDMKEQMEVEQRRDQKLRQRRKV